MHSKKNTPPGKWEKLVNKCDQFFSTIVIIGILFGCFIIILSKGILIYDALNQSTVKVDNINISKYNSSTSWTVQQIEKDEELLQELKLIEKRENLTDLEKVREILKLYPVFDKRTDYAVNIEKYLNGTIIGESCSPDKKIIKSFDEIENMNKGQVGVRFWVAYAPCENQQLDVMVTIMQQVDMNRRLIEGNPDQMEFCTTTKCIIDSTFHKRDGERKIASLVGAEIGPKMQHNVSVLRYLYRMGVRYVTLTQFCVTLSNEDPFARNTHILQLSENGGFSRWKMNLIYELNRIGFIIELNHVSEETLNFVLRLSKAPIVLSNFGEHIACRKEQHLDDYLLQLVKRNGGLILINFNCNHVYCSDMPRRETLDDIVRHIDHIRRVIGINYIAVGGVNDGVRTPPKGLEDSSKYPKLFSALIWKGWQLKDVRKVAYLNMLRVMEKVEKVKMELQ